MSDMRGIDDFGKSVSALQASMNFEIATRAVSPGFHIAGFQP